MEVHPGAVEAQNGGLKSHNKAMEVCVGQWLLDRITLLTSWIRIRISLNSRIQNRIRIKVKSWIRIWFWILIKALRIRNSGLKGTSHMALTKRQENLITRWLSVRRT
jgi:hypothetical protein